jgi:hypothetical protein
MGIVTSAAAQLLNGGFEQPPLPDESFVTSSSNEITSWTVTSGTVDLANLPVPPFVPYTAFEGEQAVDLNGIDRGTLAQNFGTVPGQLYQLTFAYADNPYEGGTSTADIEVENAADSLSLLTSSVSHSTSSGSFADWQVFSGQFTAVSNLSRIIFTSTSPSNSSSGGITLDAVAVAQIPEPSSAALLMMAAGGILSWTLRRNK